MFMRNTKRHSAVFTSTLLGHMCGCRGFVRLAYEEMRFCSLTDQEREGGAQILLGVLLKSLMQNELLISDGLI